MIFIVFQGTSAPNVISLIDSISCVCLDRRIASILLIYIGLEMYCQVEKCEPVIQELYAWLKILSFGGIN